jgi:hypothetical protein
LYGKEPFQVFRLDHPLAVAPKHDELDGRSHLMEPTQRPNEKYDRNRYADQPKQKKSTHDILLIYLTSHSNKISELKFRRLVVYGCRPIMFDNPSAVIWFRTIC